MYAIYWTLEIKWLQKVWHTFNKPTCYLLRYRYLPKIHRVMLVFIQYRNTSFPRQMSYIYYKYFLENFQ